MRTWFVLISWIFVSHANAAPRLINDPVRNLISGANSELHQASKNVRALSDRHLDFLLNDGPSAAQNSCAAIKDILSQLSTRAEFLRVNFKSQETRLSEGFSKEIDTRFLKLQALSELALQKCADHEATGALDLIYQELMSTGLLVQSYLVPEPL